MHLVYPDGLRPLQVDPDGVFVLPAAAVQELHMKVQPWRAGSRFLYVNAVDVEHRRLLTSWLVCLNILRPVLSKVCCFVFLNGTPWRRHGDSPCGPGSLTRDGQLKP